MKQTALVLTLVLSAQAAWAASIDWQGGNTNLNIPGSWYVITTLDPASRTGETRLPQSISEGGMDDTYLRNGTVTTLNSLIKTRYLTMGGVASSGDPYVQPAGTTTLLIQPGGTMFMDEWATLSHAANVHTRVVQTGGLWDMNRESAHDLRVGWGAEGTSAGVDHSSAEYNLTGGTVRLTTGGSSTSRVYVGYFPGGTGVFNQGPGTLFDMADNTGTNMLDIAWGKSLNTATRPCLGTYNMTGGSLLMTGSSTCSLRVATDGGRGWFNQSAGFVGTGKLTIARSSAPGTAYASFAEGWYNMTGGTVTGIRIDVGRMTAAAGTLPEVKSTGHLTVSNSAKMNFLNSLYIEPGSDSTLDLVIGSASDFDMVFGDFAGTADLGIRFTGGYKPVYGQTWKILQLKPGAASTLMNLAFTGLSKGYTVTKDATAGAYVLRFAAHNGDANNDGSVNVGDLGILAGNWGQNKKQWGTGDFNFDGVVNVGDLGILAGAWGWTGAPGGVGAVPEPASLVLLGLGSLMMFRRRLVK